MVRHIWLWIPPQSFASCGTLSKLIKLPVSVSSSAKQSTYPQSYCMGRWEPIQWEKHDVLHIIGAQEIFITTSGGILFSFPLLRSHFDQIRGKNWSQETWQVRTALKAIELAFTIINQICTGLSTTETFIPNTVLFQHFFFFWSPYRWLNSNPFS